MKRIWVALLVFSMLGGAVSANAISFKRKKTKKKESVEKEKTAYDKLFSSNHLKAEGFITVHKVKEKGILTIVCCVIRSSYMSS